MQTMEKSFLPISSNFNFQCDYNPILVDASVVNSSLQRRLPASFGYLHKSTNWDNTYTERDGLRA